ncbi:MAG: hypothetical protein K6G15_03015 [Desulfovibrio sp.]|nr:hypothetical protein [Desulfovibrio sp.]
MSWSDVIEREARDAYEEGYSKGRRIASLDAAIKLLECGAPIDLIVRVTGLPYSKVFELSERTPCKRKLEFTETRTTTQQNVSEFGLIALPRALSSVFASA